MCIVFVYCELICHELFPGGPDSTDPNQEVVRLTTDLLSIEETLSSVLGEKKIQYVFEGVSHLVAVIIMESAVNVRRINQNGVKKMCRNIFTIQHTLTSNITGTKTEVFIFSYKN